MPNTRAGQQRGEDENHHQLLATGQKEHPKRIIRQWDRASVSDRVRGVIANLPSPLLNCIEMTADGAFLDL